MGKFYSLTKIFSGDLEITVDFLTEVDKLVQLIESPVFACEYTYNLYTYDSWVKNQEVSPK